MENLIIHGGKVMSHYDTPLWAGHMVADIPAPASPPTLKWKGAPIPRSRFSQMIGFFRYANERWDSEAQLRMAYNPQSHEWRLICCPQRVGTGMTSNEIHCTTKKEKALLAKATQILSEGFISFGSTHSHCTASAFQSSVDRDDELKNVGLHITLGHITSNHIDVHGRVTFRGVQYPVSWSQWVEGWPETVPDRIDKFSLVPEDALQFPPEWLEFCVDNRVTTRRASVRASSRGTGRTAWSWSDRNPNAQSRRQLPEHYQGRGSRAPIGFQQQPYNTHGLVATEYQKKLRDKAHVLTLGSRSLAAEFIAENRDSFWAAAYSEAMLPNPILQAALEVGLSTSEWHRILTDLTNTSPLYSSLLREFENDTLRPLCALKRAVDDLAKTAWLNSDEVKTFASAMHEDALKKDTPYANTFDYEFG